MDFYRNDQEELNATIIEEGAVVNMRSTIADLFYYAEDNDLPEAKTYRLQVEELHRRYNALRSHIEMLQDRLTR